MQFWLVIPFILSKRGIYCLETFLSDHGYIWIDISMDNVLVNNHQKVQNSKQEDLKVMTPMYGKSGYKFMRALLKQTIFTTNNFF
jgi:hypothetical protein